MLAINTMWYTNTTSNNTFRPFVNKLSGCIGLLLLIVGTFDVQAQEARFAEAFISDSSRQSMLAAGQYTWVAFSSIDKLPALEKQRDYREDGLTGEIVAGEVDHQLYYRVVFGQFASRKEAFAARKQLASKLPQDAWLLKIQHGVRVVSESEWLPIELTVVTHPDFVNEERVVVDETPVAVPDPVQQPVADEVEMMPEETAENDNQPEESGTGISSGAFINKYVDASLQFSSIYEDNIEHDADVDAVQSYGMVPALHVRVQSGIEDPLFVFDYLVARHAYSNTERWDRISNSFRASFEPRISDELHMITSAEVSLKGSSEDRDVSNQFQVMQEVEYRFTRRHRLQLYGTYRIKRFPDQPGAQDLKPNVGINFDRRYSNGERFETGVRYEFNKEEEIRGNYKRWTFAVEYRTPQFNKLRDQFEFGIKHRTKSYTGRFVELDDQDYLREDHRLSIEAVWVHHFKRGVSTELGYEFETQNSNDPERLFDANAFRFVMVYDL